MNLDELKMAWQQQEQTLTETRKINEQLLRTMLQHRSTDAVGKMLNVEYLSFAVSLLVLLVLVCTTPLWWGKPLLFAAYVISVILIGAAAVWGGYKIRLLFALNFSTAPVTALAEKLESFRLMVLKEKVWTLVLMPLLLATLLLLGYHLRFGITAIMPTNDYLMRIGLGYAIAMKLTVLGYRKYYFRNIQSIQQHLAEIKAFRQ